MQFPRLVYKSAEIHTLAKDEAEFSALVKEGWFASVPEALATPAAGEVKPTPKADGKKAATPAPAPSVGTSTATAWGKTPAAGEGV